MGCTVSKNDVGVADVPSPAICATAEDEAPAPAQPIVDDSGVDAAVIPAMEHHHDQGTCGGDDDDDEGPLFPILSASSGVPRREGQQHTALYGPTGEPAPASAADNPLDTVASLIHGELLAARPATVSDANRPRRPSDAADLASDGGAAPDDTAPLPFFTVFSGDENGGDGPSNTASSRKPPAGHHQRSQHRTTTVDDVAAMRTTSRSAIERMSSRGPRRSASSFLVGTTDDSAGGDGQPSGPPLSASTLRGLSPTPAQSTQNAVIDWVSAISLSVADALPLDD